jgi:hypothetical protein
MIRKLIARMSTAGKKAWAAFKVAIKAGLTPRTAPISYLVVVSPLIIASKVQNALNIGERLRHAEDHAPIHSLYTCFGLAC